jgi:hypothetical protein
MKFKHLLILVFVLAGIVSALAQPNYRKAALDTTANYYQIVADFHAWIDSVQLPDSAKTREIKKFGRWTSYWRSRVQYSAPQLNGYFTPYQKAMGAYWISPSCLGTDDALWENIGPYPEDLQNMGYIQSVWFDKTNADLILVGSGRISGILKSEDRGLTWRDVLTPSRIPALGITYITASPVTNQNGKHTLYASTGSDMVGYSVGILKSDDDGETWNILSGFPLFANQEYNYIVRKVLAAPVHPGAPNPDILYAIARNQFFKSTDGGTTWTSLTLQLNNVDYNGTLDDLEVDPQNNDIIAISGLPNGGGIPNIWLSSDGGNNFTEIFTSSGYAYLNDVKNIQIDFPSSDRLYVLTRESNCGGIIYFDRSTTLSFWNINNTNNYMVVSGETNQFNRAFKVTSDHYYFYIGTDCFSISTENAPGVCISPYEVSANYHPDARCVEAVGNIIMVGTDGGLLYTEDLGSTWRSLNGYGATGLTNNEVSGFDITGGIENNNIVVGLIDNSFKFYDNRWYSGTPLTIDIIDPSNPQNNNTQQPSLGVGDGWKCKFYPSDKSRFLIFGTGLYEVNKTIQDYMGDFRVTYYQSQAPLKNGSTDIPLVPIEINSDPPKVFLGGMDPDTSNSAISRTDNLILWSNSLLTGNAMVSCIITTPSDPNIMYANTMHETWSASCEKGVYRSVDGGISWIDITGINPADAVGNQNYHVVDITVDWNNPNKVWVCMSGVPFINSYPFPPLLENRVFRTNDASADPVIWEDLTEGPNGILPPLPTTAIVNEPGSSRVFLATDGGIFCRDDDDVDWRCFSNDFPVTHITDLRINRESREIFASTYGYGMWKSRIPCNAEDSFTIDDNTGDVTWSNKTVSAVQITVKNGHKLTIEDNSLVYMNPGSTILVERGAELIIDNAILTSCESMWQGIVVMGNRNLNQNGNNQGLVSLLNGATIANARVGVETGGARSAGGIIQAENAYFYNCEYGVKMHPYRNFPTSNNQMTVGNRSYIVNCRFATRDDLKIPSLIPRSHIWLNGIQRIRIEGNVFENTNPKVPPGPGRGKGIAATNSVFTVRDLCNTPLNPCSNGIPNTFRNLHYGIYALATTSLTPLTVTNAVFDSNSFGSYLSGITQAKVTGCEFIVPPGITTSGRAYGLYLDHCTQYTIEENHFHNGTALIGNTVGMIVNNSGGLPNQVYNNTFSDLGYGILAQHDNRGYIQYYGLQVKCNDFSEVNLVDLGISMSESHTGITGISEYQGGNNSVTAPAGNTFSRSLNNPFSEIHNNGQVISKYFHHNIEGSTPATGENWVPVYYNYPRVLLEDVPGKNYAKTQACPLHSNQIPLNSAQLYDELSAHESDVNSANLILRIYRDGGIPELPALVALAYPWETYYYFNTLMLESPYLSDQTLIASINNIDLLPDLMLKLVLIANPHCTRSGEVMGALEVRNPQLPEYMIAEIMLGEDLPSPLESLEADVAYHYHLRYTTLNRIIEWYLADSASTIAFDSLLHIFQRDPLIDLKYNEVFLRLQHEAYQEAIDCLDSLSHAFDDEEYKIQQYAEYADYIPLWVKMVRDSIDYWALSSGEMDKLISLSENGLYFPAAYARAIRLMHDSTYSYEEPIIFPVSQSARKVMVTRPSSLSIMPIVNIYPNPARDYCVFDYQMEHQDLNAILQITTPQGKVVKQFTLNQPTGQKIIDLKGMADGLYYFTLKTKRNLVVLRKITVSN